VDVETPPVEVETPPVELATPPVEVDTPPVEVETPLDVLLEPVELLVEETTTLPPLPPPLPPKKPPKNPLEPPPKPPLPPRTTGTWPPPDITAGAAAIGATGMGGTGWPATVTTAGVQDVTVRTVLRFTTRATWRGLAYAFFVCFTIAGRGDSATWTAPPPMIAPPHAHAQSFAMAILTDIIDTLVIAFAERPVLWRAKASIRVRNAKEGLTATMLTLIVRAGSGNSEMRDQRIWLMCRVGTRTVPKVNFAPFVAPAGDFVRPIETFRVGSLLNACVGLCRWL